MSEVFKPYTKEVLYQISNIANLIFVNFTYGQATYFSTSQRKTKGLLHLIHTDGWGPSPVASIEGVMYYVTFIDDFQGKFGFTSRSRNQKYFRSLRSGKLYGKSDRAEGESLEVR